MRALRTVNLNPIQERTATLTLWNFNDGKDWERRWQFDAPAAAWDVVLDEPVTARHLKLGLDRETPEHLHLRPSRFRYGGPSTNESMSPATAASQVSRWTSLPESPSSKAPEGESHGPLILREAGLVRIGRLN